jgi:hypothetical protein
MPKFIRRGLDAVLLMIERIAAATLPRPVLVPVHVAAGKTRR